MPRDFEKDSTRLFKSVPKPLDPRTIGTIRVGSLASYRDHYQEAVADQGEGSGGVSKKPGQNVTLPAKLASALMGLEFMGENVSRPGRLMIHVADSEGLLISQDAQRKEVTFGGGGCTWDFIDSDALIFCMSAPSNSYSDTFSGERTIWSIDLSDADEFAALLVSNLDHAYPAEVGFPFLSAEGARLTEIRVEHRLVDYAPRNAALEDTVQGRLAALMFNNATFIKPSGPPRNFENEEEYRFQFRRVRPDGYLPKCLPEFVDIPFAPVQHLVKFCVCS
jgi:hypothetical protein